MREIENIEIARKQTICVIKRYLARDCLIAPARRVCCRKHELINISSKLEFRSQICRLKGYENRLEVRTLASAILSVQKAILIKTEFGIFNVSRDYKGQETNIEQVSNH